MKGPQHFLDAEQFLAHSKNHTDQGNPADDQIAVLAAAQAQVHATLALAAALAAHRGTFSDPSAGGIGWTDHYAPEGWAEVTQ